MIHSASENIVNTIIKANQKKSATIELNGFYLLDILFNDPPYYIYKDNNKLIKSSSNEKGNFLGHVFILNDKTYCVGDNGIYHLESTSPFKITNLSFPYSEDTIVTYHAAFTQKTYEEDVENAEDIILPKPYCDDAAMTNPTQIWQKMALGDSIELNNKYFQIEADEGSIFEIDGKNFRIDGTEYLNYQNKANKITYKQGKDLIDVNILYYDIKEV